MDGPSHDNGAEGAIAAARAAFVAALERGDAHAASSVYAEDARLLAPSAELIAGREAIEAFWRAGIEAGVAEVHLDALQLDRQDGLAYEIGRYSLRLQAEDGGAVVDRGKYVLVHQRQADGSWRWVIEMFKPDMSPAWAGGHQKEVRSNG